MRRIPFMALGMMALVSGLFAGVARMGWLELSINHTRWHGPLMVSGFLGTVISLERAIATGKRWAYLAPLLTGAAALSLVGGAPWRIAAAVILAGSVVAALTFVSLLRVHRSWSLATMGLGSACWVGSNVAWLLGAPLYRLVPSWMCFLALTILGERLQLSRMVVVSRRARRAFAVIIALTVVGAVVGAVAYDAGARLVGVGFLAAAAWLARYDMARRTVRASGVPRFSALCLLIGYGWLGVAGVLWIAFGGWVGVLRYDAILHSFFLGFVMSMILGHAPVIFPTVLGFTMRFHRGFYVPVILLHATLAMRVLGDLIVWVPGWRYGGLSNATAVVLFVVIVASASRRAPAQASSA
ncbi:hypothetical protein HN371_19780 [Candidatus Poribacteria bacterium]|jgi:hypothetical protein|nr:hypothetical protein [Candidatus Poribacteria bacterium]MBT5533598.1 hypothetical protein [Candidatus Poribacteria bacterium]MBT5712569.1 hypothetical protein [Candidatus Poribacteria bacterium]MBT7804532.1 hypothetical protein [Candidatus Poribacteria bacterium]